MRSKTYYFTSERLGFRNWTDDDTEPFAALNADPRVMEFFPNVRTKIETEEFLMRVTQQFHEYGYGWFAVDELACGNFIGFIGISHPKFETFFTPCLEIGWRLAKEYWNKGYATEGAQACLDYAFTILKVNEVYSFTAVQNIRSENVMKKIGMLKIGEFDHPMLPGSWLERHVLYKISNPRLGAINDQKNPYGS